MDSNPAQPAPGSLLPTDPVDAATVEALGVRLLGVIPPAVPIDPAVWYPKGRVSADLPLPADAPPLRPRFRRRPVIEGVGAVRQPVLDTLVDDATATTDRVRLAARLHAIGSLLPPTSDAAREAFETAAANDPLHLLNDWALQRILRQAGAHEALVRWLDRADADAERLHAAGHAAQSAGFADWALDLWWDALSLDPKALGPLLASYLQSLLTGNAEAAAAFGEMLYTASTGKLRGVLGLDRSLKAQGQISADELKAEIRSVLVDSGGSPAAVAAAEEIGGRAADDGLVADALAARLNALDAGADRGEARDAGRGEIGVLATRLGWLRERAGDIDGALLAYARAIDHDPAAAFARRRALALGRRREKRSLVHRLLGDLARRADLPEAFRAGAMVERAAVAFQADKGASARSDLAGAVDADPTFVPALAALGRASLALDDLRGCIRLYTRELSALTRQLADADAATRERLRPRLVERAVRLARLHLEDGRDHKAALAACRQALDAAPADRSAFLTAAEVFERLAQWGALAALLVARAGQTEGAEAAECLATAADLRDGQLNDAVGAAKLLARAIAMAPGHPYVLERAADIFARTGHRAAWAEVERRLGERDPVRLARAGRLFEQGTETVATAGAAYVAALDAGVARIDALDGLSRVAARGGDAAQLTRWAGHAPVEQAPLVSLGIAEALVALGGAEAALPLLKRLDARDMPVDGLRMVAAERAGAWGTVAQTLRARASLSEGARRAALLVRAGRVLALRLGDRSGAIAALVEALEADPANADAQAALALWRPAPLGATGDGPLDEARAARAAGDWQAHDQALRAAARDASMPAEARALRAAAGQVQAGDARQRDDLFERFWLDSTDDADRLDAIEARALAAPAGEARGWWRRMIRHALAAEDWERARRAAETLQAINPDSIPAALALARIGRLSEDAAVEHTALERLADRLRAKAFREAAVKRRSEVVSDPVGRARSLVLRGAWDDAYHALAPILGPSASTDAWRLAARIHAARGERVGALRAHEALFNRQHGDAAAEAALAVAALHDEGGSPGLAADWIGRAVQAAPVHSAAIEALLGLDPRHRARIAEAAIPACVEGLQARLATKGEVDWLPALAALEEARGDAAAAAVVAELGAVFGIEIAAEPIPIVEGRGLTDALWVRHVRVDDEDCPAGRILEQVWRPLAAVFTGPAPRPLVGSDAWRERVAAFFERLGVAGVQISLNRSGEWQAIPGVTPWVLAPARETPLDATTRFTLGRMAAGFRAGRALLMQAGAERIAAGIAILRAATRGEEPPSGVLDGGERARLIEAAGALDPDERATLQASDLLDSTAFAALLNPFARTADRVGLLACRSAAVAFDAVLRSGAGSPAARRRALPGVPVARALAAWAISADGRAAREAVATSIFGGLR